MESQRLVFQKFKATDFSFYWQLVSNEEVMKYTTGVATPEATARENFTKILSQNKNHPRLGVYRIGDKKTQAFIGLGKIVPEPNQEAELGYSMLPKFWGQGYGSEIAAYLVAYAKTQKEIHCLTAIIDPENIPSKRILEKNDFVLDRLGEWKGLSAAYYKQPLR